MQDNLNGIYGHQTAMELMEETVDALPTPQTPEEALAAFEGIEPTQPAVGEWPGTLGKSGWQPPEGVKKEWYDQLTEGMQVRIRATSSPYLAGLVVGIPSREKLAVNDPPNLSGVRFPNPLKHATINVPGHNRCAQRNLIFQEARRLGAKYLLCLDDDTFPPEYGLLKLMQHVRRLDGKAVIGGWYPRKEDEEHMLHKQGAPVELRYIAGSLEAVPMPADGTIREAFIVPLGFTMIPMVVFEQLGTEQPFGENVPVLDDDYTFSTLCRERGIPLLVDTAIRCRHYDVETDSWHD